MQSEGGTFIVCTVLAGTTVGLVLRVLSVFDHCRTFTLK